MKILAFSGSTRKQSYNSQLIAVAATLAKNAGAEVTLLNFADYELPLYNQDLETESGLPENCLKLKEIFKAHEGLLISSPEYNSAITPLLLNTFDWISRSSGAQDPGLSAFKDKKCSLLSASPGQLGGLRSLVFLKMFLGNIGVTVLPVQFALGNAHEAFNDSGLLINPTVEKKVSSVVNDLVKSLS